MTFGFSRDDVEGRMMTAYLEQGLLPRNPFDTLDQAGVGALVSMGAKLGRKTKPNLKLGVCGEHGGDPESIEFFVNRRSRLRQLLAVPRADRAPRRRPGGARRWRRKQQRLMAPRKTGMQPADVGLLVNVDDPRVSPDGTTVAYVVTTVDLDANEYRTRIWLVDTDGLGEPRPFTSGASRDKTPRWSPDGTRLAFVTHRDEKGSQLYVLPVYGGGEAQCIATSPEEIDDVAWSPDGATIAFGARDRDEERYGKTKPKDQSPRRITHLYYRSDGAGFVVDRPRRIFTVPADGSARATVLTDGQWGDNGLTWSPDGEVDRVRVGPPS